MAKTKDAPAAAPVNAAAAPASQSDDFFGDGSKLVTSGGKSGNGTSTAEQAASHDPEFVPPAPGEVSDMKRPVSAEGEASATEAAPIVKTAEGATVTTAGPGRFRIHLAAATPLAFPEIECDAEDELHAKQQLFKANGINGSIHRFTIERLGPKTGAPASHLGNEKPAPTAADVRGPEAEVAAPDVPALTAVA